MSDRSPGATADDLEMMIDDYLDRTRKRPLSQRFPEPLESLYAKAPRPDASMRANLILLGALIVDLFAIADYLVYPAVANHNAIIRFGILTPYAFLTFFLQQLPRLSVHRETLFLCMAIVGTLCILEASPYFDRVTTENRQIAFLLAMFFFTATLRLPLANAVAYLVVAVVADIFELSQSTWLTLAQKSVDLSQVFTGVVLSLIGSYRMEIAQRSAYVLKLRETLRGDELSRRNADLDQLSRFDGLTKVHNRRHFDQRLAAAWDDARAAGDTVSVIMADIDCFKMLNDTFGHLTGDKVLVVVADILRMNVRARRDMVARFGGEEFVILMPGAGAEEAGLAADRLCAEVRTNGQLKSVIPNRPPVTISCGVATLRPSNRTTPVDLLELADRALYRAKQAGRDRACA